ncbi:GNVR domain-containing protein [Methylobacterium oryzae CBMB20]
MQDVRRLIDAELNRIAGAAETEYQRAQANERTLTAELERLQRQSAVTAQSSVQLRELEREVEAARSVYNSFLVRAREIKEQTSIDSSNARIITAARPPQDPSWPPRLILIAAALARGPRSRCRPRADAGIPSADRAVAAPAGAALERARRRRVAEAAAGPGQRGGRELRPRPPGGDVGKPRACAGPAGDLGRGG